jgi:hypothetical protein
MLLLVVASSVSAAPANAGPGRVTVTIDGTMVDAVEAVYTSTTP